MNIIEEYVYEITRSVGDIYDSIINGIGDEFTPGTTVYELEQLRRLATTGYKPYFGIIETAYDSFTLGITAQPAGMISVGKGRISYNDSVIELKEQKVLISRAFGEQYSSSDVYGVFLGIPISEAQKTEQIYSTTLTADVNTGDYVVYAQSIEYPEELGLPLQAYVGTEYVVFSGIDQDNQILYIDRSTAGILSFHSSGEQIHFIYEPKIKTLVGSPVSVEYQSDKNPALFSYYPFVPDDWLPIAKILIENPLSPSVVLNDGIPAVVDLIYRWPESTSVFGTTEAKSVVTAIRNAQNALRQSIRSASVADMIISLEAYTTNIQVRSGETNLLLFPAFWASRPFTTSDYFIKGIGFDNLQKFEFSDNFSKAYYATTGKSLNTTFMIFRGDLYQNYSAIYFTSNNISCSASSVANPNIESTSLTKGTYLYGITVITYDGKESSPLYYQISSLGNSSISLFNGDDFDDIYGYHVYRRTNFVGDQIEYRLTPTGGIKSLNTWSTNLNNSDSGHTLTYYSSGGNTIDYAFRTDSVTSSASIVDGINLRLKLDNITSVNEIINSDDYITVSVYESNILGTDIDGSAIGTSSKIYYSDMSTNYDDYYFKFNNTIQSFENSYNWFAIEPSAAPSTVAGSASISIETSTAMGTSMFGYRINSGPINTVSTDQIYYKTFAFIDIGQAGTTSTNRGVRLTNKISPTPKRLQVVVPNIELPSDFQEPWVQPSNETVDATTTNTRNSMNVYLVARNGENGTPSSFVINVPANTERNTKFVIGAEEDIFDRIDVAYVVPDSNPNNLRLGAGKILWSVYDLITIETVV